MKNGDNTLKNVVFGMILGAGAVILADESLRGKTKRKIERATKGGSEKFTEIQERMAQEKEIALEKLQEAKTKGQKTVAKKLKEAGNKVEG